MKQSLQLKLGQQLTLTPQLQQSIRLLQLSTLDLQQEVEQFLHDNPMLERDEGGSEDGEGRDDNQQDDAPATTPDNASQADGAGTERERERDESERDLDLVNDWSAAASRDASDEDDFDPHANLSRTPTLREHLLGQLAELQLPVEDRALVAFLIEELDDDGYLTTPPDELLAHLAAELDVGEDELQVGLRLLQQFEPAGVGARNLAESLALQLAARPADPLRDLALTVARDHLPLLANRDFGRLKKLTGADDAALRAAQKLIASLNPRPATGFGNGDTHYVVADVVVKKARSGEWRAELNPAAQPRLRVNSLYAHLLHHHRDGGSQLSARLQEAKWLVRNIQQRADTILRVSQVIVERQQAFFERGEVAMRPMVLRDVADELGLHESTISRVTTQKYLNCPRGLFELKYFFGTALDTDNGGECSATAIKALIRKLIQQEDPKKPLSDSALADALARDGIQVARRTVAKYREALQIPAVSLRKSI